MYVRPLIQNMRFQALKQYAFQHSHMRSFPVVFLYFLATPRNVKQRLVKKLLKFC